MSIDNRLRNLMRPQEEREPSFLENIGKHYRHDMERHLVGLVCAVALVALGVSAARYVPGGVQKAIDWEDSIHLCIHRLFKLDKLSAPVRTVIVAPILEELQYRFLLQECLLRRLPRTILRCISPEHAHYVDHHQVSRIRCATTAALFGISHYEGHDYPNNIWGRFQGNRIVYLSIAGIGRSEIQENTENVAYAIIQHSLLNLTILSIATLGRYVFTGGD